MSGCERENSNVLRRCLKTASDGAAVTSAGRDRRRSREILFAFYTIHAKNNIKTQYSLYLISDQWSGATSRDRETRARPDYFSS